MIRRGDGLIEIDDGVVESVEEVSDPVVEYVLEVEE